MGHRSWILCASLVVACRAPTAPPKAVPPPDPGNAATPATLASGASAPGELSLAALEPGKAVHGFTASAVYLDGADQPMGARFVHGKTGFTLDYLRIESAPQGFLWVTTYPTSDKGEPHTQEHLLLGKGNRGRKLASFEAMALAESSAFTEQYRTCYDFHTVAGHDVFWPVFEDQLDAALSPDYTDEEIRREVRNFGVDRADNGTLRLEEKGTVYNEMVRHFGSNDPTTRVMIEGILKDEEEHASDLADLLFVVDPHSGKTEGQDPGSDPLKMERGNGGARQRSGNREPLLREGETRETELQTEVGRGSQRQQPQRGNQQQRGQKRDMSQTGDGSPDVGNQQRGRDRQPGRGPSFGQQQPGRAFAGEDKPNPPGPAGTAALEKSGQTEQLAERPGGRPGNRGSRGRRGGRVA